MQTDGDTNRHTGRQAGRQTDGDTDRHTGRQAGRQTDRQPMAMTVVILMMVMMMMTMVVMIMCYVGNPQIRGIFTGDTAYRQRG